MDTFEVKLKGYTSISEDELKLQKMKYIVTGAVSCADAENNALMEVANLLRDAEALSVQKKTITDIINRTHDRLWYVKVQHIVIDDLTAKEHKISNMYLVGADSAKEASNVIMHELSGMDCEVVKISDSKVDVVISSLMK